MFIWRTYGAKPLARLMARWADERGAAVDAPGWPSSPGNRVKPLDLVQPKPDDPAET